jgi:anti-sigma regulatory factor (Ser/Thr protein kinase)
MEPEPFVATLPCELMRLRELRRNLAEWLDQTDLSDEVRSSVVLATHEAAANAIEHAEPCRSVEVHAAIERDSLTVAVMDTGIWKHASFDNDERGRGLMMISVLMPHVEITSEPHGTTVRMRAPLPNTRGMTGASA